MLVDEGLWIAKGDDPVYLLPQMANRHGLIAGATGTGKTVTLKTIAQSMSDAGIPTFLADVKGDVSGVAIAGDASNAKLCDRLKGLGVTTDGYFHGSPTRFWDVYGEVGTPVRTTIHEMGPLLLGRLLDLTEVQAGVLNIAFRVADDQGMLLLDLKDLRAMIAYLGANAQQYTNTYGNVSSSSVGAIQRALLTLEDAGGDIFFGEPALDINDWVQCDSNGKGVINVLNCVKLVQSPLLYSTFLLWMLTELYETLPEVGDADKPKICFFFDEAHLLFTDAPKALLEKIEQIVKLIRSKGIGIYFITQNPADIPDDVLAQLGNRVQHALRAYTPAEQKGIKAAAEAFRVNPKFKTEDAITELGTGEALISFLDEKGAPAVVQRAMVLAPSCSMGAADDATVKNCIAANPFAAKYASVVDPVSAYEMLAGKLAGAEMPTVSQPTQAAAAVAAPAATATTAAAVPAAGGIPPIPAADGTAPAATQPSAPTVEAQVLAQQQSSAQAQKEADAAAKAQAKADAQAAREAAAEEKAREKQEAAEAKAQAKEEAAEEKAKEKEAAERRKIMTSATRTIVTSVTRTVGTGIGRNILGILKKSL